jgi:hypothetical protein
MGLVTVCWAVWKASNPRLFYKKPIYSLGEILYSSYLFMKYWASLYPEDKQQMINIGVEKLASKKWERGQTCITMMFSLK